MLPARLYKILTTSQWESSKNRSEVLLSKSDQEFIHLAEGEQVNRIISKFFAEESEVVVLELDVSLLEGNLVKEKNPGGSTEYFHLYDGSIPVKSVLYRSVQKCR